jgi:hypothetical protein
VVHQLWKQTFESGIATALLLSSMHEEILQIWLQAAQCVPQLLCSDDMVLEYTVTSALHIASQFSADDPQYNIQLTASELMVIPMAHLCIVMIGNTNTGDLQYLRLVCR